MKLTSTFILLVVIASLILFFCINVIDISNNSYEQAVDGQICIGEQHFDKYECFPLSGEWTFFDSVFLEPGELSRYIKQSTEVKLPGVWKNKDGVSGVKGFGTYSLLVNYSGEPKNVSLMFPIAPCEAYEVYINNNKVLNVGNISKSSEGICAEYKAAIINTKLTGVTTIIIHASSHVFHKGGFIKPIVIGTNQSISDLKRSLLIKDIFVLGSLTVLLILTIIFMIVNKNKRRVLSYFLVAEIIAVCYVISTGEFLVEYLIPNVDFGTYFPMYYLLSISGGTLLIGIVTNLYKDTAPKIIAIISFTKAAILLAILFFFNNVFVGIVSNIKDILVMLEFIYCIVILSIGAKNKVENTYLILTGVVVLFCSVIWDVMYAYSIIFTSLELLIPFGLIVFTLCIFIAIVKQYQSVYTQYMTIKSEETEEDPACGQKMFKINMMSSFQVHRSDGSKVEFRTKKVKELMAYMVHNKEKELTTDIVVEALWPDKVYDKAKGLLYTSMYYLKKTINTEDDIVLDGYSLSPDYYISDYEDLLRMFKTIDKSIEKKGTIDIKVFEQALDTYDLGYLEMDGYNWALDIKVAMELEMMHFCDIAQKYYQDNKLIDKEILLCERILRINELEKKYYNRLLSLYELTNQEEKLIELKQSI